MISRGNVITVGMVPQLEGRSPTFAGVVILNLTQGSGKELPWESLCLLCLWYLFVGAKNSMFVHNIVQQAVAGLSAMSGHSNRYGTSFF